MKVVSILLALVNTLFAGLVVLSCLSTSESLGWLVIKVGAGALVILVGAITFRDGTQPIGPGLMLLAGLLLVMLGMSGVVWGVHLSILREDLQNVMILFGGSVLMQGIASVVGVREIETV